MTRYLRERSLFGPLIAQKPPTDLGMVVVIPARDEEDTLITSLRSLESCGRPRCSVEVIVVVSTSESDSPDCVDRNRQMAAGAQAWAQKANSDSSTRFHILQCHDLPGKHAGVGLARKIGMDEACRRLEAVGNSAGVITCFDADSTCTPNYLIELDSLFRNRKNCQACSIHFEHPVEGNEFPRPVYDAIVRYELHLRYFIHAQRFAGFPFAVQTIGSSMAVRCDAYQQQNGMNKRQAGEDFYFLHKFTPLGHVAELKSTCVIPSPRISHRVPFGTGKAISDIIESGHDHYRTYSPGSFEDLKRFFGSIGELFPLQGLDRDTWFAQIPGSVARFLNELPFWERVTEIGANVKDADGFRIRFFRWFNAFLIMKYLHHARDHFFPDCDIIEAARWLLKEAHGFEWSNLESYSALELLMAFRSMDRDGAKMLKGPPRSRGQRE